MRRAVDRANRRETTISLSAPGRKIVDDVTAVRRAEIRGIVDRIPADLRAIGRRRAGRLRRGGRRTAAGGVDVGLVVTAAAAVGLRARLRAWSGASTSTHRTVALAGVVGAVTGLVVAGFDRLVVDVLFERVAELPSWLLAMLPGVGLLLALAARRWIGGGVSPSTADEYLRSFHDPEVTLGWRAFAGRIVAAVATLGSGAPMGLEGPSLYIGATVGADVQRRASAAVVGSDRRTLTVAGAAAGVAAIFKAPATGAVFALEVPYRGDFARRMLLPTLVAAASGYLVFACINGTDPLFPIEGNASFEFRDLAGAVVVGGGGRRGPWLQLAAATGEASPRRPPPGPDDCGGRRRHRRALRDR